VARAHGTTRPAAPDVWAGRRAGSWLERALPGWLTARRWFGGKARALRGLTVLDAVPLPLEGESARLALVRARYAQGRPEIYSVPVAFSAGARAHALRVACPGAVIAPLTAAVPPGILHAAEALPAFAEALLGSIARGAHLPGRGGEVVAWSTRSFPAAALEPHLMAAEQSNTSIRFGGRLILKLFRRVEAGQNPDLEVGAYLTEVARYRHVPPVLGGLEYRPRRGQPWSLGILQAFVPNEGDAWRFTLDAVGAFLDRAAPPGARPGTAVAAGTASPSRLAALVGPYLAAARLLGRRTAGLHLALAAHPELPDFEPVPYAPADQRRLLAGARGLLREVLGLLRRRRGALAPDLRSLADGVLAREAEVSRRLAWVVERPLTALRTRIHGDYHLGQVLWTGRDFMIIDFEGEPARPLSARRAKASPLRDVAGMLRSFQYAAHHGLATRLEAGGRAAAAAELVAWAAAWQRTVSEAFLGGYLRAARAAPFLPETRGELEGLLDLFVIEKALYELAYELNNRPTWVGLPLRGIAERLGPGPRVA